MARDWVGWHAPYDDPGSSLAQRLTLVKGHVAAALDAAPSGAVRVVSACAGQGRDVLEALPAHPRRDDVTALLVERDPANCAIARAAAGAAGLADRVRVVQADAGVTSAYAEAVPAHVLLFCGVFGNVSDDDVRATIAALPSLCAPGAVVLWTRHRRPPDRTPAIRGWFATAGFDEVAFEAPAGQWVSVGVHRLTAPPSPYRAAVGLFTFTD